MANKSAEPWDVRLIGETRWWRFNKYREATLIMRWQGELVMVGMSDKGFGFVKDLRQFSGELTANKNLHHATFRLDGKGDMQRFLKVLGRKSLGGYKLDSFKAIAYIFGFTGWEYADEEFIINKRYGITPSPSESDC